MAEQIFSIKTTDLNNIFHGAISQGFIKTPSITKVLEQKQYYINKPIVEKDPSFKQLIPYQIFIHQDTFFVYQRGSKVGERRLSQKYSLGIGGHLNYTDSVNGKIKIAQYNKGLARERDEELICKDIANPEFIGWINDDSDPVGQVHIGAVHLCRITTKDQIKIRKNAEDIHFLRWMDCQEIMKQKELFEPWSILALGLMNNKRTL